MSEQQIGGNIAEFETGGGRITRAYQWFRRWPVIPVAIALTLIVVAIFAELVSPHDPLSGDTYDRNEPPAWAEEGSSKFLLGTDHIGRDVLSRMIFGARVSLIVVPRQPFLPDASIDFAALTPCLTVDFKLYGCDNL